MAHKPARVGTLFVPLCLYAFMPLGTWVHVYKQRGQKSIAHPTGLVYAGSKPRILHSIGE